MTAVRMDDAILLGCLATMTQMTRQGLLAGMTDLAEQAAARLAGGPLGNSATVQAVTASDPDRVEAAVGSDLPYAGVLEYGFSGSEQVSAHLRLMTQAFGHPVLTPHAVLVSACTRHVDLPARHVLSGPLEDMQGDMAAGLGQAVAGGLTP